MCGQHCYMDVRHGQFLWLCRKKIEAFETWLYRRMLRISWRDIVTKEEVYRRMNIKQSLLVDIVRRQMSFLGQTTNGTVTISKGQSCLVKSCVQNNNQRLYEDMILIDDEWTLFHNIKTIPISITHSIF